MYLGYNTLMVTEAGICSLRTVFLDKLKLYTPYGFIKPDIKISHSPVEGLLSPWLHIAEAYVNNGKWQVLKNGFNQVLDIQQNKMVVASFSEARLGFTYKLDIAYPFFVGYYDYFISVSNENTYPLRPEGIDLSWFKYSS